MLQRMARGEEILWINPKQEKTPDFSAMPLTKENVRDAQTRLERFAPVLMELFPQTRKTGGIIESPLTEISGMKEYLRTQGCAVEGHVFLKRDSDLAVAGSVKARGGIYEVLKHAESIALSHGLLTGVDDDYLVLTTQRARELFSRYKVQVGSTGNLGLSIGIMSARLGFEAIVHMSADAKAWKKELLRRSGVDVREYAGDYSAAVASGRALSEEDSFSYFVDDEHSKDLFLGYAACATHLHQQLIQQGITVDDAHPLFLYIPCGVGGAPGGITFGAKLLYGRNVHCFFVEPTQAPCMVLGMASGQYDKICVQDIGLNGQTIADGLAVGRCSSLVAHIMDPLLAGEATVKDERLIPWERELFQREGLFIEPSSCACFQGLRALHTTEEGRVHLEENGLHNIMNHATHILWATGGSLMPQKEREQFLEEKDDDKT